MDFDDEGIQTNNQNTDDNVEQSVDDCNLPVGSKTIDYFIDEQVWDKIGKELKDYDANDMDLLKWRSLDDCIDFYETYAKVKGFGVRRGTTSRSRKDNHIISKTLVCRAQGQRRLEQNNLPDRQRDPRPLTRFGCRAFIQFRFHEEYMFWKVQKFHAEHNHALVNQKQVSYIRSFRRISEADDLKIRSMRKAGIAPNRMMRQLVNEAGSREGVQFTKKDLYNRVQRIKREVIKDGDAETVLAYLFGLKASNPSFFIKFTRDEDGNLENLFWSDGISRMNFKIFGHALAFDTTYRCNAYNKPFVVLVGVNHHRNTVPFGCALVVNENEPTFVWVLQQLIEAGDGFRPLTVITDGDKAMANAIVKVLPEARHRLCLWHIMRNVKGHLKGKFLDGFIKCVKCRTPNDFEKAWKELVNFHNVQERRWAKYLYEIKEKWSEAYLRGHFYAGMRSTQRCESMHRTLKRMLDRKVFLYDFVQFFHEELNELKYEESRQDYKTTHEQPFCEGILSQLKSHASKIYTRNSYHTLCSEMSYEGYFLVKPVETNNDQNDRTFYWLQHVEHRTTWYLVVNDIKHDTMYCCCMKLESVGFPCRHMFAVLKYLNAKELPQGCIMRRWTIFAKEDLDLLRENETRKKRSEISEEYIGIGDPIVIETRRGKRKKTKARDLSFVSAKKPANEIHITEATPNPSTIDLNHSPQPSPTKAYAKMNDATQFSTVIMDYMPNTYKEGALSQESCIHELRKMDDDPSIFDWKPHKEW